MGEGGLIPTLSPPPPLGTGLLVALAASLILPSKERECYCHGTYIRW